MNNEIFERVNALQGAMTALNAGLTEAKEKVTGEHYEIFAGCMENYIEQLEKAQSEIYQEAKMINEHSKRMMDAIKRSIGHIKEFR